MKFSMIHPSLDHQLYPLNLLVSYMKSTLTDSSRWYCLQPLKIRFVYNKENKLQLLLAANVQVIIDSHYLFHPSTHSRFPSLLASTSAGIKFLSGGVTIPWVSESLVPLLCHVGFQKLSMHYCQKPGKFQEILSGTLHCTLMEVPHLVTRTSNPETQGLHGHKVQICKATESDDYRS